MNSITLEKIEVSNRKTDLSQRKAEITVGVLILLATITFITGDSLIGSLLSSSDYLSAIYTNSNQLIVGVLLEFVDAVAIVGVGVILFPILKKHNEAIAISYVGTRLIECATLIVSGIGLLLLAPLSLEYVQAGSPDASYFQTLGSVLIAQGDFAFQMAMLALGLGSIPFCYLLYKSNLIPRTLAVLGLIGYAALFLGTMAGMFGFIDVTQGLGLLTVIPGGLFELILPIWLFVKGFNSSADSSS